MVITVENVLLSVRHLKKTFGDHVIFADFNMDVRKGEVVVIIGPSGCGKSTLLRCLNGLEPIQGGEILLDGEPVLRESKSITRMRQKIGMVFQSYELFPHKTILENILLAPMKVQKRPRAEAEKEALELLERVGLADRKDDYPRQLSGGQKQRVAIVRASIRKFCCWTRSPQPSTRKWCGRCWKWFCLWQRRAAPWSSSPTR